MAAIHVREIEQYLEKRDGDKYQRGTLIQFDDPNDTSKVIIDESRRNMLMSLQSSTGNIILAFDDRGQVEYLEFS